MSTVALLGPQRFDPTVAEAARQAGITGRIALVTAGWQEREPEDDALSEHLQGKTVNLELYRRASEIFREDEPFRVAHQARQQHLMVLRDFYRIRLNYLLESADVIANRSAAPEFLEAERTFTVEALQVLDRYHLSKCRAVHRSFEASWQPHKRELIAKHRQEIAALLEDCDGIAIAGGHIATLTNRLRLFDLAALAAERPILAWSAGAMAICDRIVLFHDSPPHGFSVPQLLGKGIGQLAGIVALPDPLARLDLDNRERMGLYAKRFAPAHCITLPRRSFAVFKDGVLCASNDVSLLRHSGEVQTLPASFEPQPKEACA
jgi:hypothetical protein